MRFAATLGLFLYASFIGTAAIAQDYDGLYKPDYDFAENWSCAVKDLGMDGGSVGIFGTKMVGVENQCNLLNPRQVPGVPDTTKYDEVCFGEGTQSVAEITIAKTATGIRFQTDNGQEVNWIRCETPTETAEDQTQTETTPEPEPKPPVAAVEPVVPIVQSVWDVRTKAKPFENGNDYFYSVMVDPKSCTDPNPENPTTLHIQCTKDAPSVFINVSTCNSNGASYDPVQVRYKFDRGALKETTFSKFDADASWLELGIWQAEEASAFINELAGAEKLTLAYTKPDEIEQFVMNFDITGFANHLPEFGQSCKDMSVEQSIVVSEETPDASDTSSGEAAEKALDLSRAKRREVQSRLTLLGYNTRGVDGVFGPGSRAAIRSFQADNNLTADGFLNAGSMTLLKSLSQDKYVKWNKKPKMYYGNDGCLRHANGRIVRGRNLICDIAALTQ